MAKTNKHSRVAKIPAKSVVDYYKDLFTLREKPASMAVIERICQDLVQWAVETDDALTLGQFFLDRKISPRTVQRWAEKYDVASEALSLAKCAIGVRREVGAIKGQYNVPMIMSQQAKYDKSWQKLEEWRAELRARSQVNAPTDTRYTVVVEDFSKEKADGSAKDD